MIKLPKDAQDIVDTFHTNSFEIYAVGGSVRDLLINRQTHGWDFTTNATPEEILKLFPDSFYDNQFGTVGIKLRENDSDPVRDIYEVTTYRSEQGYADHRHPDKISWGKTLQEDISRRDFTINAIAFDGKIIIDPFNGQKDLADKLLRSVGNPNERFIEDALRMMRAVRQASELGFMIAPETLEAVKKNVQLLRKISMERIRDELLKLLASPYAADGILMMKNTGILSVIIPELEPAFEVQQKSPKRHHIYDVGTHSVMALKNCPSPDPIVRLATLLHDIGKIKTSRVDDTGVITFYNHEVVGAKLAKEIGFRLRLSKKQIEKIVLLIRWHQFTVDERQTDNALRRFIRHIGKENLEDMLALRIGDRLGGGAAESSWRLELFKKRLEDVQKLPFSVADLKINGHDVMTAYDTKPGPIIGKALELLFAQVEEGTLPNEREALMAKLDELKSTLLTG